MEKQKRIRSPLSVKQKKIYYGQVADKFIKFYYYDRYKYLFGVYPLINWGKDKKHLANLVKNYYGVVYSFGYNSILELLESKCEVFFKSETTWVKKRAYSINAFYCEMPTLMLRDTLYNINIKGIINGYKSALVSFDKEIRYTHNEKDDKYFSKVAEYLEKKIKKYTKYKITIKVFSELYFVALFEKYHKMKAKGLPKSYQLCTHFAIDNFNDWLEEEGGEVIPFLYCSENKKRAESFNAVGDWTKELR